MTDDEIRQRVRERLANRTLPLHAPATAPVRPGECSSPLIGSHEHACAACDRSPSQLRYDTPSGVLAFHARCHKIWEEERDKGVKPAG